MDGISEYESHHARQAEDRNRLGVMENGMPVERLGHLT
jgi:hypothetical protein